MFEKILIANRGEIACRVIRTCRRLGIYTIAVYSQADKNAQHVRQADEAWPIGGSEPAQSYLRGDTIVEVAMQAGAQAIHPGYGFLSENPHFARACAAAGIVFIGPKPESIEAMGSKSAAKALMAQHRVPLVAGYYGDDQDGKLLADEAHKIGYPLLLKPSAGGGGKGMEIVRSDAEFPDALARAQRVAQASFGDGKMLLERYIEHPRHIEFQIFGDSHGHTIHLDERECSSQRRYQKVLEETPSPFLDAKRRAAMGAAAVAAAKAVDYLNAGTVEFIVGPEGDFHFMEMNTRLQVEHPVTEMTHGIDLVEWQLRIASGEPLPLTQEQVHSHGHAFEARLYAEDPDHNFLPSSGTFTALRLPQPSPHFRVDGGVIEGDTVTIFYDPMIAKLIAWDTDRPSALQRLRSALATSEIAGPKSNIAFLERLARHPAVVEGRIDSGYLDRHLDEFVSGDKQPAVRTVFAAALMALLYDEQHVTGHRADPYSPWSAVDGWRIGAAGKRTITLATRDSRYEIAAWGHAGNYRLQSGDSSSTITGTHQDGDVLTANFDEKAERFTARADATHVLLHDAAGTRWHFERVPEFAWDTGESHTGNQILAPMPGRIVLIKAKAGDAVEPGQELLVLEAMKMELSLKAPRAGAIEEIAAAAGEFVEADTVLVRFAEP